VDRSIVGDDARRPARNRADGDEDVCGTRLSAAVRRFNHQRVGILEGGAPVQQPDVVPGEHVVDDTDFTLDDARHVPDELLHARPDALSV
jgi:hypothetical protein